MFVVIIVVVVFSCKMEERQYLQYPFPVDCFLPLLSYTVDNSDRLLSMTPALLVPNLHEGNSQVIIFTYSKSSNGFPFHWNKT